MLPGGNLYVRGAEKIIPHVKLLMDAARDAGILVVSSYDAHEPNDPEFADFPPHCVKGTPGAEILSEAILAGSFKIPNDPSFALPENLHAFEQLLLEKQTLEVFDNPHTHAVVEKLGEDAEYFVFGVVTEICVMKAAKALLKRGRRVSVIRDAIKEMDREEGRKAIEQLASLGARIISAKEAISELRERSLASQTNTYTD